MTDSARTIVSTDKAPGAIGPYSQAIKTSAMVFVSGQLALEPNSGNLVYDDIKSETRQAIGNLKKRLEAAGSSLKYPETVTLTPPVLLAGDQLPVG